MSLAQTLKENIAYYCDQLKIFIFGENNVRLDKLIDRFYSMREEKRAQVRIFAITGGITLFILILFLYFYGLFSLQYKLNNATDAYLKVQEFKPNFLLVQNEYTQIASKLETENQLINLIPAINQVANALEIQIDGLSTQTPVITNFPSNSILAAKFNKAKINFQITGISLKRLTDFLNNVHNLPNKFALTKLDILQVLGNKLYFNVTISLEAFVPIQQKS